MGKLGRGKVDPDVLERARGGWLHRDEAKELASQVDEAHCERDEYIARYNSLQGENDALRKENRSLKAANAMLDDKRSAENPVPNSDRLIAHTTMDVAHETPRTRTTRGGGSVVVTHSSAAGDRWADPKFAPASDIDQVIEGLRQRYMGRS